jgi:transcriptional regulator with XRE-family HTH domain
MDAKQTFGWNLRKLRVERGLSQQAIALSAGVDPAYVGRIERGKENLTINMMELLALQLSVSLETLLREVSENDPAPQPLKAGRKPKSTGRRSPSNL